VTESHAPQGGSGEHMAKQCPGPGETPCHSRARAGAARCVGLCLLACLAGFGLRIARLDAQPIWWDEAISLHLATSSVPSIIADRAANIHPPLYFLLLKGWVAVAGTSAFSARFFSVWFGTLLIPAVYAFGRRFANNATGVAASMLTAGSAAYIVYSQESRAYAILPLVYIALLGLVEVVSAARKGATSSGGYGRWLMLAGIQVVGLHLHYTFAIAVAYVNAILFTRLRHRRPLMSRWVGSLALVIVLCLPWTLTVLAQPGGLRAGPRIVNPFAEALPLGFFLDLMWTFQWTGLSGATGTRLLQVSSWLTAALLAAGLALLSRDGRARRTSWRLVANWLVPMVPAALLWQARPFAHPRYVLTFSIALFLSAGAVLAKVVTRRVGQRMVAAALSLTIIATTVLALVGWYSDPQYAKDDTRGLARWLAERDSDGPIIAPFGDWTLDFTGTQLEERGNQILRPDVADEGAFWETLSAATDGPQRAYLISYPRDERDPRGMLAFALESAGDLIDRHSLKGILVRTYDLAGPIGGPPSGGQVHALFGAVGMTSAWIESRPPAGSAVTLALGWTLEKPTSERYRVSLRLHDPDGWIWTVADDWLLDSDGRPTDEWHPGAAHTTYHVLPIPPGLPPITYSLSAGVYYLADGDTVMPVDLLDEGGNPSGRYHDLGDIVLQPAAGLRGDPYGVSPSLTELGVAGDFEDGLALEAASIDRQALAPGQSVFVTLRWHASKALPADMRPSLMLVQGATILTEAAQAPANGMYPTALWKPGETVLERRRLTAPPGAREGSAQVIVQLDGHRVELGEIKILSSSTVLEQPEMAHAVGVRFGEVAELLGYDLGPEPHDSDHPLMITLYWRALPGAVEADYTVFAQILAADGHLVAQHDGTPAAGARPTRGWLEGEIVTDVHLMAFREPYGGPATIVVGLYNAASVDRVLTSEGETAAPLPSVLDIVQP